jgi:hypothetical protein
MKQRLQNLERRKYATAQRQVDYHEEKRQERYLSYEYHS